MRILICLIASIFSFPFLEALEISSYFAEDEEAAFLLFDLREEKCLIEYNPQLCQLPSSPCSTFKIPNALIALDLGIVEDENTLFEWDGSRQLMAAWEKDLTLLSAIRYSAVWYFQRIAEKVGENQYQEYLAKFDYGNRDISYGLTQFWLGQSLLISPDEQLRFLIKLYTDALPVSTHALEIVKKILVIDSSSHWCLSGKTGSCIEQHLGWFIGYLFVDEHPHVFVTYMRGGQASGKQAKTITQQILHDLFRNPSS